MAQEERHGPSPATGAAALRAGWSHSHRDVSGGWLRPAVFGAVDGLVTNGSLISGLGGGGASAHAVVLTGVAALVAGAFSMGTGEYISVTNQNELIQSEVSLERRMLSRFPAAEQEELAGYFRQYGADADTADRMAAAVSADPGTALRLHAREELGIDPDELPSPVMAGVASLIAFSAGALVPLFPYLVGAPVLGVSLALTAIALVSGGMVVGRLTGRPLLRSGLRQILLGAVAIGVTYLVGSLIGDTVPEQDPGFDAELESRATDRLTLFSDAVVAIAITLLAIDLPVPDGRTTAVFLSSVRGNAWDYLAFLITFVSIAGSWSTHHDVFRNTRRVDARLRQLDMAWLLMIVLLPFAARLLGNSDGENLTVHAFHWGFYALVQTLESGILLAMLRYMTASGLSAGLPERIVNSVTRQSYVLMAGFGSSIPVLFATSNGWLLWIVVPLGAHLFHRSRRRSRDQDAD